MKEQISPLLNVADLDRSVTFYEKLGFDVDTVEDHGMTWATVRCGKDELTLVSKDIVPPREQPADTKAWLSGELGKGVLLQFGVKDAEAYYKKAKASKAKIDQDLDKNPWGGKGFSVVDPDGYVILVSDNWPNK